MSSPSLFRFDQSYSLIIILSSSSNVWGFSFRSVYFSPCPFRDDYFNKISTYLQLKQSVQFASSWPGQVSCGPFWNNWPAESAVATQEPACMISGKREFQGPLIDTARAPQIYFSTSTPSNRHCTARAPLTYEYINKTKRFRDFALIRCTRWKARFSCSYIPRFQ